MFFAAALVHFGVLLGGYEHQGAGTAENVIGAVLLEGLALPAVMPSSPRRIGLIVQTFALLGTLLGFVLVVIGVGPRAVPDVVYHIGLIILLVRGLLVMRRARM